MSKTIKKDRTPLRFDTSSANINCFIHSSAKTSPLEPSNTPASHRNKRKNKSNKQRSIQFQEKVFLQSVVSKILNDADCQGISQLIQSMVFPPTKNELDNLTLQPHEEIQHLQISEIFSDQNSSHKKLITFDPYPNSHPEMCRIYYQTPESKSNDIHELTTVHSHCSSFMMSPREQYAYNEMEMLQYMPVNYPFCYYEQSSYFDQGYEQRKKRGNNEQNLQYKIVEQKIDMDGRTTVMIRHIPNKYTEEMLKNEMAKYKNKINFVYLPLDRQNSCNVGYAFVNFIDAKFITAFYAQFKGRKWDYFNSQKICELAYARIQGTSSLISHYENSMTAQIRGRTVNKLQERKSRSAIDLNMTTIKGLSKMIVTQKEEQI